MLWSRGSSFTWIPGFSTGITSIGTPSISALSKASVEVAFSTS